MLAAIVSVTRGARRLRVSAALVLLPGLSSLPACSKARGATGPPAPVPVAVATAVARDVTLTLSAIGTVEPHSTVAVRPQVAGQIVAVHFREGSDVKAGQALFDLDPRPYEAALAQAESTLARDQAQARHAAAEAGRADDLLAQGILSKEAYDQLHASADALAAAVRAGEAAVSTARLQLDYCAIRAPIDGRTGRLLVQPGNVVKAVDGGPLVVINQVDPVFVSFAVPEARLAEVKTAAAARRLPVEALLAGQESRPVRGELAFLDNEVDRATGTVRLKAGFANSERRLWPGQFVTARLALETRRGAIVVPAEAVQEGQAGTYVFVVKPDRTAELRSVSVGPTAGAGEVVLEQGVSAGEAVVTDGQVRLVPGARTEPRPTAARGAS